MNRCKQTLGVCCWKVVGSAGRCKWRVQPRSSRRSSSGPQTRGTARVGPQWWNCVRSARCARERRLLCVLAFGVARVAAAKFDSRDPWIFHSPSLPPSERLSRQRPLSVYIHSHSFYSVRKSFTYHRCWLYRRKSKKTLSDGLLFFRTMYKKCKQTLQKKIWWFFSLVCNTCHDVEIANKDGFISTIKRVFHLTLRVCCVSAPLRIIQMRATNRFQNATNILILVRRRQKERDALFPISLFLPLALLIFISLGGRHAAAHLIAFYAYNSPSQSSAE